MIDFAPHFAAAAPYDDYLARHAGGGERRQWSASFESCELSPEQLQMLQGFRRRMKALCLSGTWCGDCAAQCPILARFAEACDLIELRFLERDDFARAGGEFTICGGERVPTVIFLSEDDFFCGVYGDKSLTRYRQAAGVSGPMPPGVSAQQMVIQEWLDEFERIQLMLVTSPRLQRVHGR